MVPFLPPGMPVHPERGWVRVVLPAASPGMKGIAINLKLQDLDMAVASHERPKKTVRLCQQEIDIAIDVDLRCIWAPHRYGFRFGIVESNSPQPEGVICPCCGRRQEDAVPVCVAFEDAGAGV